MDTLPKVCLMMSGLPRFRADTDTLINNLTNFQFADWVVSFWRHKPRALSAYDNAWQGLTEQEAIQEIQSRLPPTHRIRFFEWVNPDSMPSMPRDYPEFYSWPVNCWQQYSIFHRVNQHRLAVEAEQKWKYDLIIRARADAGSDKVIDLGKLWHTLNEKEIHMPNNQRHGNHQFCDHWGISKPNAMTAYADVINHFDTVFNQGIPYNPEIMVGNILHRQGYFWPRTDWNSTLKTQGRTDPATGIFYPDEGRWSLKKDN